MGAWGGGGGGGGGGVGVEGGGGGGGVGGGGGRLTSKDRLSTGYPTYRSIFVAKPNNNSQHLQP